MFLSKRMVLPLAAIAMRTGSAAAFATQGPAAISSARSYSSTRLFAEESKPFAVVVKAEIEPDRMAEFLDMIKNNAEQTRKEPGCIRFDVLRSQDAPNEFFFYELYKDEASVDYHKQQPHYNSWAEFKASGGTISSVSYKTDGEFVET